MNFSKVNAAFGLDDRQSAVMAAVSAAILTANLGNILRFLLPRIGTLEFLRLHYTARLGVDWVDDWWKIFTYPGLGLLILTVNGIIAGRSAGKNRLLGRLSYGVALACELLLAIGGALAVSLNG